MDDILVAVGLVLVVEGLIWAISPGLARRMLEAIANLPEQPVRLSGVAAMALGVVIVWSVRGA
ncbi:MAG TPA: DUF2065 domain-containing protein [Hyphomicrobiaceae bacterium]|nr:DUF2065 domain-containing protein [Hyphomicrobiaceae bacterium]